MRISSEADEEDVSMYMLDLIKCGIVVSLGQTYKETFMRSNLLEIQVWSNGGSNINIKVCHIETNKIMCSYNISYKAFIDEIIENYNKYIITIQNINKKIIESRIVKRTVKYYNVLTSVLEITKSVW